MSRVLLIIGLISLSVVIFAGGNISTFIPLNRKALPAEEFPTTLPTENNPENSISFFHGDERRGNFMGFEEGDIALHPRYSLFREILADLNLAGETLLIIGASSEKSKIEAFIQGLSDNGIVAKSIIEADPLQFIKNFRTHTSQGDLIVMFQDSPLLTSANQKLLATLIISLKKILITLGISSQAPGILSFTPVDNELKDSLNKYFSSGEKSELPLTQVNFNLRYAAVIGLKFKTTFLTKVKRVI